MIEWLFDTTLYTGLLIALVLLLRRPVTSLFGPQIAYALWALPLARLVMPPLVLPARFAPEAARADTGIADGLILVEPMDLAAAQPGVGLGWAEGLVLLWLSGGAAFLIWRTVSYRRMRRDMLREARPMGEVGTIRLVETPTTGAPVAFGLFDKVVALPPLFMAQPDLHGRDLAIAHELAHHRGHDLAANFAAQALLALHWWNPVAWAAWRAMRRDQEAACDARVMAGRGREDRARYATLLAGIAAGPRLGLSAPMACPMLGDSAIVHRLRALARSDLSRGRRRAGRGLLAVGLVALPFTASISYAAADVQAPRSLKAPTALPALPAPPAPPPAFMAPAVPLPPAPPDAPEPFEALAMPMEQAFEGEAGFATRIAQEGALINPAWERENARWERERARWEREAARIEREVQRGVRRAVVAQAAEGWGARPGREAEARSDAARAQAEGRRFLLACMGDEPQSTWNEEELSARCEAKMLASARQALEQARQSIAADTSMPPDVRQDVLAELDGEIAEMRRQN